MMRRRKKSYTRKREKSRDQLKWLLRVMYMLLLHGNGIDALSRYRVVVVIIVILIHCVRCGRWFFFIHHLFLILHDFDQRTYAHIARCVCEIVVGFASDFLWFFNFCFCLLMYSLGSFFGLAICKWKFKSLLFSVHHSLALYLSLSCSLSLSLSDWFGFGRRRCSLSHYVLLLYYYYCIIRIYIFTVGRLTFASSMMIYYLFSSSNFFSKFVHVYACLFGFFISLWCTIIKCDINSDTKSSSFIWSKLFLYVFFFVNVNIV